MVGSGSSKEKEEPTPRVEDTMISPPRAIAMFLLIIRPKPTPS